MKPGQWHEQGKRPQTPELEAAAFGAPAYGTPGLGKNGVALLDLLRALAANAVLVGHASAVFGAEGRLSTAGTLGVGVFFILSGFLILQSSLSRLRKPAPYFAPLYDRPGGAHIHGLCSGGGK